MKNTKEDGFIPEIKLENGERIPRNLKSLAISPWNNSTEDFHNEEDDYEIILITGGNNTTVNIKLSQPAIIILEGGTNNVVNAIGGMALPISQAALLGGVNNIVNGLAIQNPARIISPDGSEYDFGIISVLENIDVFK